jgi:hypothetical protein
MDVPLGEYVSSDGQLKFLVTCPEGDWTIGFDGFPWHTHGSILAALSGRDEVSAIQHLIDDLTGNISVIALKKIAGILTEVWISEHPAEDLSACKRYGAVDETMEFRLWDGTTVRI